MAKIVNSTGYDSSFWGDTVLTTAHIIADAFGIQPDVDVDKCTYNWCVNIDGVDCTVYDYTDGDLSWNEKYHYHIGAKNPKDSKKILAILTSILK